MLRDGWALYTGSLVRFVLLAGAVFGPLALLQFLTERSGEFGVLAIFVGVSVVGFFWLQGALVVVVENLRRRAPSLPILEIYRRVAPRLWPLVGAGLLVTAAIVAGAFALVVPGILLLAYLSMVAPIVVLEKRPIRESFERSWRLVHGDLLRVLTVIVVTVAIATMISAVIAGILQPVPDGARVYVIAAIASAVTVPFVTVIWAVMYFELRFNKDPVDKR